MYDVIIIGSGPAGLTAAIYTTRDNLKTLIIAGLKWGGQLQLTTLVENFPGFPEGVQGPDLMLAMRKQAEHFGAEIIDTDLTRLQLPSQSDGGQAVGDFSNSPAGGPFKINAGGKEYSSRSIIIATGTDTKWLGVKGEAEKIGHGVSSCAPCDAPFFKNKNVIVVGGGNSAMEEALVLSNFAKKVSIAYRKEVFTKASQIMLDKVQKNPKIEMLCNCEIIEVIGESKVERVKLKNTKTAETSEMPIDGIFVAIRRKPNSELFKGIEIDQDGYIKTRDQIKTNIDGVFVAGDVHNKRYQQAVTAAGYGAMAAMEVQRWLEGRE